MGKINSGYSAFSSGPALVQAVPVAQRTPTIPMEYGIPKMTTDSFDSVDGRTMDIPEFMPSMAAIDAAYEYKGENANSRFPKLEGNEQHREVEQHIPSVRSKEPLRTGSMHDDDGTDNIAEDGKATRINGSGENINKSSEFRGRRREAINEAGNKAGEKLHTDLKASHEGKWPYTGPSSHHEASVRESAREVARATYKE